MTDAADTGQRLPQLCRRRNGPDICRTEIPQRQTRWISTCHCWFRGVPMELCQFRFNVRDRAEFLWALRVTADRDLHC